MMKEMLVEQVDPCVGEVFPVGGDLEGAGSGEE
jgi:hypothetical protein